MKLFKGKSKKEKTENKEAEAYFEKGAELGQKQQWPEAIQALKEAVRLDPDHAKAHMTLMLSYAGAMDLDSAKKHYEILKKLDPALAKKIEDSPAGMLILRTGHIIKM